MRQLRRLIFTLACISCTLTTWAAYNGTPQSPQKITSTNYSQYGFNASNWGQFNGWYAISSAEELYGFARLVNGGETTVNGVLTTNIVVNADVLDSNGNPKGTPAHTWTPIGGTNSNTFKGTFDGNGHTVSGLYYKSNTGSYIGLISTCGGGAIIRNVGVVDSYLYGQGAMGGICGYAYNPTGGLPYPIIKNCYNASTITAAYKYGGECGGILGRGYASITNCYNIGTVTATVKGYCHSICGEKEGDAYYERNYYLSTKEADNYATSMPASLFANGTVASLLNDPSEPPAWFQTISEDAYPVLDKTHDEVSSIVLVSESNRANYELSSDYIGYFAISNKDELYSLAEMVNNGFFNIKAVLANDIVVNNDVLDSDGDLNGTPDNYWTPIGTYSNNFSGTFDGNGHTVSGLYFNNTNFGIYPSGGNYVGLIGYATNATIKNVGVIDSYINGNHPVGGICGYSFKSTIKNCYCTSTIVGTIVGGILGEDNSSSTIGNCYFASSSTITNCYPICGGYNNKGSYSKNYYLETSISDPKATLVTAEQFESGYVAYLLNGSSLSGTVWRQNIGQNGDKYPVLDITHNKVSGYTTESNNVITVTGNMVLSNNFVIPSGKTLKIPAGASVTTTGTAVITNNGTIVCNGDIYGNNLAGSGTFKTEKLADADIAMASSYEYKGSAYTVENGLNVTINANRTICGKTFTFDNAAYTVSYSNNRNVGTGAKVTWKGPSGTFTKSFSITAKTLTVTIASVANKVYDGNITAQGTISTEGIVTGDNVTVSHTATFADKTIGTGKTVTFNYTKSGADAGNYVFAAESGTTTANITAKTITVAIASVSNKVYDGNATADGEIEEITDIVEDDDVTVSHTETFADKNVGTGKTVTFSYTKSGADAGNYAFASTTGTTTANITAKTITVAIASVADKVYDGNATADGEIEDITDIVEGDDVTVSYPAAFADKNVGTGKTVTFSYTKSGADAGNYAFASTTGTTTANITAKTLTLYDFAADSKTYDGTTTATNGKFKDYRVTNDKLEFTFDCNFDNKNVGTNKTVSFSNIAISGGADAANYNLVTTTGTATAKISPKAITLREFKANDKDYDGKTTAEGSFLDDRVAGDKLNFAYTCTFDNKNVGKDKTVTIKVTSIESGADKDNYSFTAVTNSTAKAEIRAIDLTLDKFAASNKTYNGKTDAEGSFSDNRVTGDKLEFSYNCNFENKNVGTGKTVSFSNIEISGGADAGNYNLVTTTGTATANITARTLALSTFTASNKPYDGKTAAEGSFTDNRETGDKLEFTYNCNFENKNVGTGKTVSFSNIAISGGADATNYNLATTTGTATANITAKTLTLSDFAASNKPYDGTTTAQGSFADNRETNDELSFTFDCNFDNKNVGTNKTVSFSNIAISGGADAANYNLATTTGTATANITAKTLTLSDFAASNKPYDGKTAAEGSFADNRETGDKLEFSYNCNFENKNVGTGKTVSFSNIEISGGADAGNYNLVTTTGTATANITARTLALSTFTASNKPYDGTTTAQGSFTDNRETNDELSFTFDCNFDNKNVGTNKTVSFSNIAINGGADAGNYNLTTTSGTAKADISAKALTVSIDKADNKVYDGTTTATGTISTSGIVSGDDVNISYSANFDNQNAGTGKTVTFNFAKSGADAGNYNLATTTGTATADITPFADEVVVTIALKDKTVMYNGEEQTYKYEEPLETASSNSLYAVSFDNISATAQPEVKGTNVGEYAFGWKSTDFSNINANFSNVRFDITDAKLTIEPYIYAEVYVTENSDNVVYDSTEHVVSGYMLAIADTTGMLAESDITFSGDSIVKATAAGVYDMNVLASDFANTNANFSNVKFNIVDGQLTISKAAEPSTMPESSMETYYLKTHFIGLPANWAWAEDADLNIGSNSAVANYVGADAGNYVKESQTVSINRVACPHSEGSVVYDSLPATCTHRGYTGNLSCKLCGEIYEKGDSTEMLPHTPVTDAAVAATCHSTGLSEGSHCSVCGTVLVAQVETAKIAHTIVVDTAIAATCTTEGLTEGKHCSVCDSVLVAQVELPALGHDTVAIASVLPTCTEFGLTEGVRCSVCGEVIKVQDTIPALGHTVVADAAVAATCTEDGLTEGSHCSVCGEVIKAQETIPALGHSFTNYIYNNDATYEADGTETAECDHGCGETHTRTAEGSKLETVISDDAANEVVIYAHHNIIVVENAVSEIRIYDVTGRCVAICGKEKIDNVRTEIAIDDQGLYIVKCADKAKRVVLK